MTPELDTRRLPERAPLAEWLDDPVDQASLERVRRRVHATRRLPRVRRWAAPLAAVAAAAVLVLWLSWPHAGGPIERTNGSVLTAEVGPQELPLADGSVLSLSAGTRIETVENTASRLRLVQGDGQATYHVQPHGPRRWTIDLGDVEIDVVGTKFTVDRNPSRTRVEVERGVVLVHGALVPGGMRTLRAGDSVVVEAARSGDSVAGQDARDALEAAPHLRNPEALDPDVVELEGGRPEIGDEMSPRLGDELPRQAAREPWHRFAERGDYNRAFESLGADELARRSRGPASVEELFSLSDTARLSGHPRLAVEPLSRIVEEHETDARAGLAAFTLGRLHLDALDQPSHAVRWLEEARTLRVPDRLQAALLSRLIEAHRRAGHADRVDALQREQARRFPDRLGTMEGPEDDSPD